MAKLTIKLPKTNTGADRVRRIDAAKLNSRVLETRGPFRLKLRNYFQALEEELVEPNQSWDQNKEERGRDTTRKNGTKSQKEIR